MTLCNVLHLLMVTHRLQLDQHTELLRHKVDCVNETSVMALKANVDHYRNSVMCSITNVCDPPTHLSAEPVSPETTVSHTVLLASRMRLYIDVVSCHAHRRLKDPVLRATSDYLLV